MRKKKNKHKDYFESPWCPLFGGLSYIEDEKLDESDSINAQICVYLIDEARKIWYGKDRILIGKSFWDMETKKEYWINFPTATEIGFPEKELDAARYMFKKALSF